MTMKKISNTSKAFDEDKATKYKPKVGNSGFNIYRTVRGKWVIFNTGGPNSTREYSTHEWGYNIISVEHATDWFLTNGYKKEDIPEELHKYVNDCIV